jgi:hypothetical protein
MLHTTFVDSWLGELTKCTFVPPHRKSRMIQHLLKYFYADTHQLICLALLFLCIINGCSETTVEDNIQNLKLEMYGAFPNPWVDSTIIAYSIANTSADSVVVSIYSTNGEQILQCSSTNPTTKDYTFQQTLDSSRQSKGYQECLWRGTVSGLPTHYGLYYYTIIVYKDGVTSKVSGSFVRVSKL